MRSHLECVPCFFAQAIRAARLAGLDDDATRELLNRLGGELPEFDDRLPPPVSAWRIYQRVAELSGCRDPFAEAKARHTDLALGLLPALRRVVSAASDPLDAALRVAVAGNVIDLGALGEVDDIEGALQRSLVSEHSRWDVSLFADRLSRSSTLLVIGDNAGETVFDRVLLETVGELHPGLELHYAVRGAPAINDATEDDARAAGVDQVAQLVSTGSEIPGVVLDRVTPPFRERFLGADLVLAKGQGNYETLSEAPREVFFLLAVKCRVVATDVGIERGSSVLLRGGLGGR